MPVLVADVSVVEEFNQKIDIYTLLPVLAVPLNVKVGLSAVTIAVLEIALRERSKANAIPHATLLKDQQDFFQETQYLIVQFGEVVKEAYRFVFSKIGDHRWNDFLDYGTLPAQVSNNERQALDLLLEDRRSVDEQAVPSN